MKIAKKRIIYTALVILIVVFSSTFAVLMTLERNDYRNYLQGEYGKSMYELIDAVQNIRVNLTKAAIVGSREQAIVVFEEIFRYSGIANDKLHSLPVDQPTISGTSKFLSQTGDFCYNLGKLSTSGKQLTNDDYDNIERLKKQSVILEGQLKATADNINQGKVKWGEIRKKITGAFAKNNDNSISEQFQGMQKQIVQYPALIYDGPFSDNVLQVKPKINSQKQVSEKKAEAIARKIIGEAKIESLNVSSVKGKADIDVYRFTAALKNRNRKGDRVICEISKKGGRISYLINDRAVNNSSISAEKSRNIGIRYLKNLGYDNMVPTYSLRYNNIAVISYVYNQNNILIYPDQIKLKIALDNGDIIGVEADKYLMSHIEKRKISTPKMSYEEAKEKVGKRLNITGRRLVIIPTEANSEILCYEFSGDYKNDDFKVYINAETGYEEKIIQIINTPNGELTI
ncbi:germination protein YpeB [Clostridium sp. MT-14]|uniref:Germination protein YpeB n=1 Tax=Clostridium aromativorans TaxID=2836848 RepID=A0ABS8N1M4_9CLOT|nr:MULTISPECIES: germination protein YpeB [Clostridium]KAA8675925.1 germination protein YpeB [Clostridium sp. HV4-5-A1G]MCC9293687.1 germination protein YpeB [Clostridium aromativorans]CAB1254073.1 Spore germination protein YpeB [Clostridiaceae bacterium BL-3]